MLDPCAWQAAWPVVQSEARSSYSEFIQLSTLFFRPHSLDDSFTRRSPIFGRTSCRTLADLRQLLTKPQTRTQSVAVPFSCRAAEACEKTAKKHLSQTRRSPRSIRAQQAKACGMANNLASDVFLAQLFRLLSPSGHFPPSGL